MDRGAREKKLKILLPVLIVISIFVWLPNFQGGAKKTGSLTNFSDQDGAENIEDLFAKISLYSTDEKKQLSSFEDWGKNPFVTENWIAERALQTQEALPEGMGDAGPQRIDQGQNIVLNGIFWNSQKPSALINNEVLGVGMQLNGYKVVKITRKTVVVDDGVNVLELRMQEQKGQE
ncbi:MAG: hypothetical protein KC684_00260 [Candidatus Omnitrophica bacterium]|nr:hypothetical protein [Candidatus Omnitrophota bacterium]